MVYILLVQILLNELKIFFSGNFQFSPSKLIGIVIRSNKRPAFHFFAPKVYILTEKPFVLLPVDKNEVVNNTLHVCRWLCSKYK